MLIDRSNLHQHLPWIVASLVVAVVASVVYFASAADAVTGRVGSSAVCFVFGVLGGIICLFEFLLWPRKKLRAWRVGRTQIWMRAHIWLGLLAVPLLVYHSGFRWGGSLAAAVMVLFLVVVASGVWGLVMQQFIPTRMFEDVPAETICSQIPRIAGLMAGEAERLVLATCGGEGGMTATTAEEVADVGVTHMVVGMVRQAGGVQGVVLETLAPPQPLAHTEPLAVAFRDTIRPYLTDGARSGSPLRSGPRAGEVFRTLRERVNPEAHPVVERIEELCTQRRQLDLQERLHFWLHNWLLVHLPLSAALIVLMLVHAFVAVYYW